MALWFAVLCLPLMGGVALMIGGVSDEWLFTTLGVLAVLSFPPLTYWKLRDRRNIGVRRWKYRPERFGRLRGDGELSWHPCSQSVHW